MYLGVGRNKKADRSGGRKQGNMEEEGNMEEKIKTRQKVRNDGSEEGKKRT